MKGFKVGKSILGLYCNNLEKELALISWKRMNQMNWRVSMMMEEEGGEREIEREKERGKGAKKSREVGLQ